MKRPRVHCKCCDGTGKAPLSDALFHVLQIVGVLNHVGATVADVWGISEDRCKPTAFNNRLEELRRLGLVTRSKRVRKWVYRLTK